MNRRIICLLVTTTLMGCSTASSNRTSDPLGSEIAALQARLQKLEDNGAAEILTVERYRTVVRAVSGIVGYGPSLEYARTAMNEFETEFDTIALHEATSAKDACITLQGHTAEVKRTVSGVENCTGLTEAVNNLDDRLSVIRRLAYRTGRDVFLSHEVRRLVLKGESAANEILVAAAVCSPSQVNPGNAARNLAAADRMAENQSDYASPLRLYANIVEAVPGTEAAETARRRINNFGPGLQQRLTAVIRASAETCDTEAANLTLEQLDSMMSVLSERASEQIDPWVLRDLPDIRGLLARMDSRCARFRPQPPASVRVAQAHTSLEVSEVGDRIPDESLKSAQNRNAGLTNPAQRNQLETRLDDAENLKIAHNLRQAGTIGGAITHAELAWETDVNPQAGSLLAECLATRAFAGLKHERTETALADVQRALIVAPESADAQNAAAAVFADLGNKALAAGRPDDALRFFRESTRLRDNGFLSLEMARLLAARRQLKKAREQAELAERLGVLVDPATRLQVFARDSFASGDIEATNEELERIAGNNQQAFNDLRIHLLRLPLSTSLGLLAANLADAGGLIHNGGGVLAFVGTDVRDFEGSPAVRLTGERRAGWSGFSDNYRFMFFSDHRGNTVVFDARAGGAAQRAAGSTGEDNTRDLALMARAEIVEILAWFLVSPFEHALNSDMETRDVNRAVMSALAQNVAAGLDYAVLADSRGKATHVAGSIGEGYETGLMVAAVSVPNSRPVTVEGEPYREVVAPVKIGNSVQAMLVMGVAGGTPGTPSFSSEMPQGTW